MSFSSRLLRSLKVAVRRYPVISYFAMTFTISWLGALSVAVKYLIRQESLPPLTGILMFPAMLLGPAVSGIVLTRVVDGRDGLRNLFGRMFFARFPAQWYATLLGPPTLVMTVLLLLKAFASPAYAPNRFFTGILFGVPAGFLEEIGWTGYAFPKMRTSGGGLSASMLLGVLWSLWHLPVITYLGAATPHGAYWFPFFLAFIFAMTAIRVVIGWVYTNTRSVLLAQLMHVSSTGALVIFSPPVTAAQEVWWYALYGITLWIGVWIVFGVAFKPASR